MIKRCVSVQISQHERESSPKNPVSHLSKHLRSHQHHITSSRVIHNATSSLAKTVLNFCPIIQKSPELNTNQETLNEVYIPFVEEILRIRK